MTFKLGFRFVRIATGGECNSTAFLCDGKTIADEAFYGESGE